MIDRLKTQGEPMTFAEFAKDHEEHAHCIACGQCLIDPSPKVRLSTPIWCVGCRDRIKVRTLPELLPWRYGWENS